MERGAKKKKHKLFGMLLIKRKQKKAKRDSHPNKNKEDEKI
jgi:hypothetical protein